MNDPDSSSSPPAAENSGKDLEPTPVKTFSGHTRWAWSAQFLSDPTRIASSSQDGSIRIWDVESGQSEVIGATDKPVYCLAMLPGGRRIASGGDDQGIRIWDVEERKLVGGPWKGHSGSVRYLDVSPDGCYIASGSYDRSVKIWDLDTEELVLDSIKCEDDVFFVKFSRDGLKLVTGSQDGSISIWARDTGELLVGPMKGHENIVRSVVWTLDDEELISASADCTIRRWNAATGEVVGEPLGAHDGVIWSLALSSDGKILASTSSDKMVKLWNASTFEQLACFAHEDDVYYVGFSPDDTQIASGCSDGMVYLWDVPPLPQENSPDGGSSFLDLPAVIRPEERIEESARGGPIDDFLDFPAVSRPSGNYGQTTSKAGQSSTPKKRFADRFKLPLRKRSRGDGAIEMDELKQGAQQRPRIMQVAAAKSKKFIVVVGKLSRSRQAGGRSVANDPPEDDHESEESTAEEVVDDPESDSDSENEHGCCWRCCRWFCYDMVKCYL
ncbi:hypothetical protein HYDPIDRAFT_108531 [Hydnomerulius pinastri MD-312]|nr:hypothetical protein HYDPIDRAFT_108531 [Hydnomerulius pinastri MD-312]